MSGFVDPTQLLASRPPVYTTRTTTCTVGEPYTVSEPNPVQVVTYGAYGVSDDGKSAAKKLMFVPRGRSRVNVNSICANIFCPWLLFTFLYYLLIFRVHYEHPYLPWLAVMAAIVLSIYLGINAYIRKESDAEPSWYTYAAGSVFGAAVLAAVFGNMVFWSCSETYYDYLTLNTYSGVNPQRDVAAQVMDAGRVYFAAFTHLDQGRAMGFKNKDTYCVVPITSGQTQGANLQRYDFWAVGKNCCSDPGKFQCGADWDNRKARSALRLMDEDQRPFFRLAVQQAEAAYGIKAPHPIFFHWSQDPLAEMHKERVDAVKYFAIGTMVHFMFNFCSVLFATFAFAKLGDA